MSSQHNKPTTTQSSKYSVSTMKTKVSPRCQSAHSAEKRLHKTCDQMEHLQDRITLLQARHQRALQRRCGLAVAESLRLQLSVLEGVYAMYYTYAEAQSEKLLAALTPTANSQE